MIIAVSAQDFQLKEASGPRALAGSRQQVRSPQFPVLKIPFSFQPWPASSMMTFKISKNMLAKDLISNYYHPILLIIYGGTDG
jgi:hypothetical protein